MSRFLEMRRICRGNAHSYVNFDRFSLWISSFPLQRAHDFYIPQFEISPMPPIEK